MFANFFKSLIVSSFGSYIEDFTAKDIEIDKWNGSVVKQNCVIKRNALESMMMSLVGAPIKVVRGYIQNLRINVPWSKLLSSPVQINLDEIHIVLKASSAYDAFFAKKMLLRAKKVKVSELLEQIKKSQSMSDLKTQGEENDSYMKRLRKIVSENLQITVKNVHIRFEDSYCARKDQMLNLGIIFSQLNYSMTNSDYQRVFINIDDKKREQRSYSMLELQSLAVYWNSNAKENWHKNKDFLSLSASKHIDHSKKFVEGLRKKYQQYKQNLTANSVFLIQPCDIRVRFRKNLSPHSFLEVPKSTTAVDISGLQLSVDEEVYKDTQYLMKFFAWHQKGTQDNSHFKFRPPYNIPAQGNASLYWKYAISSTVYYIRKTRREKTLRQKRQNETLELSELYMIQQVNEFYERQGYQQRLLASSLSEQETGAASLAIVFQNQQEVEARIIKLEMKLSAEQIVIAMKRADKKAKTRIQEEESNTGWKSWLPGKLKNYYQSHVTGSAASSDSAISIDLKEFDEMVQSYQDIESDDEALDETNPESSSTLQNSEAIQASSSPSAAEFRSHGFKHKTLGHMSLLIPKIDIAFVSKKQGSQSKYFMQVLVTDFVYQSVTNSRESQTLVYFKNLEVVDKLIDKLKFSKALYKREKGRQNQLSSLVKQKVAQKLRFGGGERSSQIGEIEEEVSTNVNNGLPLAQDYESILQQEDQEVPFLILQLNKKTHHRKGGEKHYQYRVEFFMNAIQVFYNRQLMQRTQTFINTASISRTQNASAEADFDSRLQQFKQKTEDKVKAMLKRSEIYVTCNVKGIETLIPDNTNYDASKFIILQTGNLVVRNGQPSHSHYTLRNRLTQSFKNHHPDLFISEQEDEMEMLKLPKSNDMLDFEFEDEYSLTLYDAVVYYVPSFQQLENFNFIENQSEFERFEILKKTDFHLDLQSKTTQIGENKIERKYMVQAGFNSIEVQLTNKEIKELKNFSDNFVKYHEQISIEVERDLQSLERINVQQAMFEREFNRLHRRSFDMDNEEESTDINREQDIMLQTILTNQKSLNLLKSSLSDTNNSLQHIVGAFESRANLSIVDSNMNSINSNHKSFEDCKHFDSNQLEEEDDNDEFFDAQDVFDQDIIQMLKLDKNFQKMREDQREANSSNQVKYSLVQQKIMLEFWINKVKVNILEAANLQKDIIQGLQSKLGNFFVKDQLEFDVRFKGVPFLYFELGKLGLLHIRARDNSYSSFGIQELALINLDNNSVLKKSQSIIFKSQNFDYEEQLPEEDLSPTAHQNHQFSKLGSNFFKETPLRQNPLSLKKQKTQGLFDPEEEDRINTMENNINQDSEQFLVITHSSIASQECKVLRTESEIKLMELSLSENLMNKIIQTLIVDFPTSHNTQSRRSHEQADKNEQAAAKQKKFFNLRWEGMDCKLNIKKEVSNFKIMYLTINQTTSDIRSNEKLLHVQLGEIRVLQNDQEIFLKSIEAIDEYDRMLDLKISTRSVEDPPSNDLSKPEQSLDQNKEPEIPHQQEEEKQKSEKKVRFAETPIVRESKDDEFEASKFSQNVNLDLNLVVVIFDSKLVSIFLSSIQKLLKSIQVLKPSNRQAIAVEENSQNSNTAIQVSLNNSYLQVPLKDNKNSMFIRIRDFQYSKVEDSTRLKYQQLLIFIARSQFQEALYPLVLNENLELNSMKGLLAVSMNLLALTINENYILFLANLVDNHFDDVLQIQEKLLELKNQSSGQVPQLSQQQSQQQNLQQEPIERVENEDIQEQVLTRNEVAKNLLQIQLCEITKILIQKMNQITSIASFRISELSTEWVFGLGFDDHEDNFVTLFNKNQSLQILQQFDLQQDVHSKLQEFDFAENLNKKSTALFGQQSEFQNPNSQPFEASQFLHNFSKTYERVILQVRDLNSNIIEFLERSRLNKDSVAQFNNLSLMQIQKSRKPQVILSLESDSNYTKPGFQMNQRDQKHQDFEVQSLNLSITNQSARVISNLCKSLYSCKNILKRGKKRQLFKQFFGSPKESDVQPDLLANPLIPPEREIKKISQILKINKWRVSIGIIPDKKASEYDQAAPSTLMQMINSKLKNEFELDNKDQNYLLVIEGILSIQKYYNKMHKQQRLSGVFQDFNFQEVSVYLDPSSRGHSYSGLLNANTSQVVIVHPFKLDYSIESYNVQPRNEVNSDLHLELIEVEISLRQIFFLKSMVDKIVEEFAPLTQVVKHYTQNAEKQTKRREDAKNDREVIKKQQGLQNTSVSLGQVYLVLLKESGDSSSINDQLCLPLFSVELKRLKIDLDNQKVKSTQLITGGSQVEVYYFNQKLNFYEPFVEKTQIDAIVQNSKNNSQSIQVAVSKTINVNFSVAFYETVFLFQNTLKEEKTQYEASLGYQKGEKIDQNNKDLKLSSSQFYIKNSTGETLMFKTTHQPTFFELQPEESNELDFDILPSESLFQSQIFKQPGMYEEAKGEKDAFVDFDQDEQLIQDKEGEFDSATMLGQDLDGMVQASTVSKYRRERLRYLRGEPKKVFIQVIIVQESLVEKSSVFEINIENLSCQRIYLDEQRQIYIICQMVNKHGQKHLIIRSPMQITNNLQIPLEIQLLQNQRALIQKSQNEENFQEERQLFGSSESRSFDMLIQPEQSMIIPLKACGFQHIRMRPMLQNERLASSSRKDQTLFEWTSIVDMSLLSDEREIFEKKPLILSSKVLNADISQRKNDQLFFILNANVYSIRSFIDFNTQQTEFISLKYLQISPPFTIQNLLPVALTLVFKNIIREPQAQIVERRSGLLRGIGSSKDKQHYMLETKMNSSNQTLFLNPLGNFELSICIPGFDNSTFMNLKEEGEEDYILSESIDQENYVNSMFEAGAPSAEDGLDAEGAHTQSLVASNQLKNKNQFRFLKQKKQLFQLTSQYQNQFNVCANFAYVQGFYHISFYSKYWFLNNTQMPLEIQMTTENFAFDKYDLPYENVDFDFETIEKFIKLDEEQASNSKEGVDKNGEKPAKKGGRRNSLDSYQTETVRDGGKSHAKYSYSKSQTNKHNEQFDNMNYKELQEALSRSNPYGHNRLRPWESYKISDGLNQGLIAALTNEEINKVSTIYMAQEMMWEENVEEEKKDGRAEQSKLSKKNVRFLAQSSSLAEQITEQHEEFKHQAEAALMMQQERQTMISKTSIQYLNYHDFLAEKNILNLNHLQVSKPCLYETPLQDRDQLKRVVLFSESPVEEQIYPNQQLRIKISDSLWSHIPFDINKIQGQSISIQDKTRLDQRQSLFEVVSQVQYLPYPFSFSKLITFNSRYTVINKTYQTLYVIQSECEENGIFKVYPQETSVFHWTDSKKESFVSVKLEDYEYSGKFPIDQIGEFSIRLKSTFDSECIILNVLINDENNQFFILVSDISYAPPYRIENLTKTTFKVAQQDSRSDDFDIIKPFGIISFAWSYPLANKKLSLSICSQSQDTSLGPYSIDHINKNHSIILKDKKNNRDFILEIINEKTMKCVRIMNAANAPAHTELIKDVEDKQQKDTTHKLKLTFKTLGVSVVNSQAREIAYILIENLKLSNQKTNKNKKVSLRCNAIQIDNQLVRQNDAIVLKKQQGSDASRQFVLKMHTLDNQAIENLYYYKYFFLQLAPFDLNLDGNFCDESYKYLADVLTHAKRYSVEESHLDSEKLLTGGKNLYDEESGNENQNSAMKQTFNELKKPLLEKEGSSSHSPQKKVFFEQLLINDIKLNFSFQSSPMLFREFSMNPTIKFVIVLLSNLRNVQLKFNQYKLVHQHLLLPIFLNQIKKHYVQQCYSHQQFIEIVTSMGILGNLSQSADSLKYAFNSLLQNPFRTGVVQFMRGGVTFCKHTMKAVLSPIGSVAGSLYGGLHYLLSSSGSGLLANPDSNELNQLTMDRDLFEDDISQVSKELNSFSSPLALIDTQNRIWIKIISREKQNYEVKKKQLKKRYQGLSQSEYGGLEVYPLGGSSHQGNLRRLFNSSSHQSALRPGQSSTSNFFGLGFQMAVNGALFIPRKVVNGSVYAAKWVSYQFSEQQQTFLPMKKRYPRFVNFRMELESYNEQKALALQILNDINLIGMESETIQRVFSFKQNSIIFTGKRVICVASTKNPHTNTRVFEHWNILFKDIIRVKVQGRDVNANRILKKEEFIPLFELALIDRKTLLGVHVEMRIFYHQVRGSEGTNEIYEEDSVHSTSASGGLIRQGHHHFNSERLKIRDGSGVDLFGDLRIGEKNINASYNECKQFQRLYRHLSKMIDSINIIK